MIGEVEFQPRYLHLWSKLYTALKDNYRGGETMRYSLPILRGHGFIDAGLEACTLASSGQSNGLPGTSTCNTLPTFLYWL